MIDSIPLSLSLAILHEDAGMLVVNKPTGLLTQAPTGIDSLEHRVKDYLQPGVSPAAVYLGVPHRLDRPTSGVVVFGKQHSATRKISQQFERRTLGKTYWACVQGVVPEDRGTWRDFMRKVPDVARAVLAPPIHPDAREAVLHFEVIRRFETATLLEIRLETGRMHQIRVQAASRSFPIWGDTLYASTIPFGDFETRHGSICRLRPPQCRGLDGPLALTDRDFKPASVENAAQRSLEAEREHPIALHARSITLDHPQSRERLTFTAPLPELWTRYGIGEA